MLETNAYVRCLLIDFLKAFDVVDHVVLVDKLSKLEFKVQSSKVQSSTDTYSAPPTIDRWRIS